MKKGILATLLLLAFSVGNVFSQSMTISGGNDNGLIICSQGLIYAWGKNMQSSGECLGVPSTDPNYNSTHMFLPGLVQTNNLSFSQVTAGSGAFHLALSCHKLVYAWGDNSSQACGQGDLTTASSLSVPKPVLKGQVEKGYNEDGTLGGDYLGGVKWIAGSTSSGFAITEDNKCVMWGIPQWDNKLPIGVTSKEELKAPVYVRDKNGNPIENVTHISGGDENVYMRTSDGELWALGTWNGNRNEKKINENYATKVLKEDGTPLTNIKMSAAGDQCGFAVTGDGFVWGWGDAWAGCNGQKGISLRARKVNAGDYSKISGESYLTDVTQVIGGRGHGAAVTKEGYLLYWGSNDGTNGGVAPDPLATSSSTEANPIFAFYCKPGTCDVRGDTVKNAVAISRGDNFDFMVNDKDEYYGWGKNDDGQLGVGQGCDLHQCLTKIETIPCDIQDACPIVYMTDVKKCPGETIKLNCGFTIPLNKEKSYYIQWYHNGDLLNTSKIKKGAGGNYIFDPTYLTDIYNNDEIEITEAGKYKVIAYYVGDNIPCDACDPDSTEITVTEMSMPVDTIINEVCVPDDDPFNPTTEEMNFKATVNSFYSATSNVQFAVFATPDLTDKDTLTVSLDNGTKTKVCETTGDGGELSFTVTGSQINHDLGVGIEDNKDKPSKDTLYHVWIEDVTRLNTKLLPKDLPTTKTAYTAEWDAGYGQLVNVKSNAEIMSFSVFVTNTEATEHTVEITPVIYKAGSEEYGNYIMGPLVKKGEKQSFPIAPGETKECIVKVNIILTATVGRGADYMISCEYKNDNCKLYLGDNGNPTLGSGNNKTAYITPEPDTEGFGISAIGNIVNKAAGSGMLLHNITFGKMTDYDCGRIQLTLKRYCPPCNNPKKLEIISTSHTIKTDVDPKYKKVVELCKESDPLDLDIEPLVGQTDPAATFDILWYDEDPQKNAAATALKKDETGTVNTLLLSTDWATVAGATDITEDAEKVYYVYVHDHEKVGCPNYDSIKVIAHPAPVDTLAWDTFCLTTPPAGDPVLTIDNKTITWTGVDPTGTIPALTATTSFPYTVTDDKTGCVSEPHTFTVTVNSTDKPKVDQAPSTTVDANGLFSLTTTISTETSAILSAPGSVYEIRWFDNTKSPTSKDVSRATAGTYTFYTQLYNTETECASEMVEITLTINDALPPRVINESLCLGDNIPDITEYVTKTLKPGETDADYELLWYSDLNDATPIAGFNTAFDATTEGEGEHTIYVSQKSTTAPFAESAKTPLTITVHKVATLDLTANRTDYCVTDVAEALTFTQNSDGDFSTAMWSTSLKSTTELNNPSATLSPNIIKGTTKYYVLPEFTNSSKEKNYASDVCYGTIQDIDINVNFTDIPNPDKPIVEVQYLKAQGDLLNRYDDLLTQDPTSVTPDANCTLKWFDASQSPLTTVPAPDYIANETGERRVIYWVSQYNTVTGCESEMKKVVAVISSIPMPTTKAITLCQGSSKLDSPFKLDAQINTANGAFSESDFKLVWYKENPDKKATATAYNEIDLSQENLDYDYTTETEKDFVYYVRQVETRTGGDESPTATLVVSIYSKPILTTTQPAPICIGEFVDIKNLYEISNRIDNKTYENEYLSATGRDPVNGIAKENGVYKSRAYFTLESGETCVSDWANVTLTVNELKIEIKGDDKTCPNIGKDMEALVTSKNMLPTDNPTYTWNVSPTGEIARQKIFNMSNNGLANNGDKLTISLNVEMGACKATASHILTVEDPGVNGNISFDEEENTNSGNGKYSLSSTGIVEFDGCNRKVDVAFEVDQTEEDFTYTNLESGLALPGKFTNGKGEISVKAGLYEVSYTNTCKTSFKFDIKDKSLNIVPLWSNLVVCEGEPWNIEIKNSDLTNFVFDPNKYKKIEWKRDNDVLSQFNNKEVLNIPQTSPSDNGIYSCIVQSSGCTSKLVVGMGGSFTSKPKVTVNEALLENGGNYEAIRTKDKKITIPFLNPTGAADLAKLESNTIDGIIWKENGVQVNAGATYDIKNVVSDHEYNVVIARGQGGSNDDFCGTSVKINLKVDALLAINTSMVDEAGKEATDMCINEEGTGILIDTTGTGNVLHPENLTLKVVEKIDNQTKDIPIKAKEDKLFAEISPSKSATYDIVYKYTVGNQDSSKSAKITVHPAYEVEWDKNVRLCEGESGYIEIKKKEPANVTLTWQPDPCISKSSENGATVTAILSGDDVKEEKKLALVASNNGICADKTYYPSFIIDKSIEGEIVAPEYICEKHTATLYAKYDATDYVWSSTDQLGEGVTLKGQTVNVTPKTGYASYIVDMKRGACTLSDEVDIDVREAPKFDRIDSVTYKSIEIVLQASTGTAPFQYIVDNNPDEFVMNNVKEGLDYGEHNISVIDDAKCKIDTIVYINNPGITIPIVVSPNDDNVHDKFVVPNLKEAYPDAKIRIFDRWGKQLTEYRAGDEGMDWDGTYNGVAMPSTDYWYEIQIKEIQKTYTGHFTLIRQ